jgi:hypothetical protein
MAFRPPEYAQLLNPAANAFLVRRGVECQGPKCPFCEITKERKCHCDAVGPREWSPRTGKCHCKKVKSDLISPFLGI